MSIKNIFFAILSVAVFSSFGLAQGGQPNQPNQPGGEKMRRMMIERRMDGDHVGMMRMRMPGMIDFSRLNLTDAQKQRIQTIMESQRQTAQNNQAQMEEMMKLMQLKRQGLLTTQQGTRLTALEAQMTSNHEKFKNDILAVLTPEQKILFEQMQNNRGGRMRGKMFQRRGPAGQNRPGMPMGGGGNSPQRIN